MLRVTSGPGGLVMVVVRHVAVEHVLPVVAEPKVPVVVEWSQAVHIVVETWSNGEKRDREEKVRSQKEYFFILYF